MSEDTAGQVRRGRRPRGADTRAQILAAAQESFATLGYSGTTMRGIARAASVDSALVHHYFGSKDDLFLASLALPFDPRELLIPIALQGAEGAGERLLRTFVRVWDDPESRRPLLALVQGVFDPAGRSLLREGFLSVVLIPIGVAMGITDPERRMALVASQIAGLIIVRYVVELPPLVAMSGDDLVAIYAPTIQRYLTGELPSP